MLKRSGEGGFGVWIRLWISAGLSTSVFGSIGEDRKVEDTETHTFSNTVYPQLHLALDIHKSLDGFGGRLKRKNGSMSAVKSGRMKGNIYIEK